MLSISRKYEFCAAHRLFEVVPKDHPCNCLHGHNYYGEITLYSDLTEMVKSMFIDFSVLKSVIGTVSSAFDHRAIFNRDDPFCALLQQIQGQRITIFNRSDPTVEHMTYLWTLMITRELLQLRLSNISTLYMTKVSMYETQNNFAEYSYDYSHITDKKVFVASLNTAIADLVRIV